MSKFNLKKYQKINLDQHITQRLKEQHEDAPNTLTERQLDDGRVDEKDSIMEKQLEKVRKGAAEVIIEKNLNDSKGMFSPLRNNETHTGDINKLEEKRLSGKTNEKEKYEPASKTPNSLKWWESLKKASSANAVKTARSDDALLPDEKALDVFEQMGGEDGVAPDLPEENEFFGKPVAPSEGENGEGFDEKPALLTLLKQKDFRPLDEALYFQLGFDSEEFGDDIDSIKEAALNTVLEARPELEDKIGVEKFSEPVIKPDGSGTISLRLVGPEYFQASQKGRGGSKMFRGLVTEEVDVGGTSVTVGRLMLSPKAIEMAQSDEESFSSVVAEWILEKEPELLEELNEQPLENYLNFSAVSKGEITFAIGTPVESVEGEDEEDEDDEDEDDVLSVGTDDSISDFVRSQAPSENQFPIIDESPENRPIISSSNSSNKSTVVAQSVGLKKNLAKK